MLYYRYVIYDRGRFTMYSVGEKIVYGENGVCTVIKVAPLEISGASKDKLYYYLALFKQHSCEALVAIVKGLHGKLAERKTKSSRAETTMKRAKDILHGELSTALGIELSEVEDYIAQRIESN